jgi:hypothetical protein
MEIGAKVRRWHNYPRSNRFPWDYEDYWGNTAWDVEESMGYPGNFGDWGDK